MLASGNLRYTRIPKTCVFVDSTFRFFLPCFVSPSSSTVTRVLNHAQMSFADVLLHGRTYRTPRIFSTTISKNAYPYTRSRTCGPVRACTRVEAVFVRTQGRRPHGDVDVDYASVSMVTIDVGPGPYAFNPTSMMMCGGSRGVVEEGAGRRRIKSSKSFYLSTLLSSFALFFPRFRRFPSLFILP